jgi:alpha-amylase/alpha-mannosidase (GH57 family)
MNALIRSRGLITFLLLFLFSISTTACAQQEDPTLVPEPTTSTPPTTEVIETPTQEADPKTEAQEVEAEPPAEEASSSEEVTSGQEPIYLSIIWHQHQPVYFKDPESNVYERPWVRMHAAKDYVDMAAILEQYPDIQATFNLTPSLIEQLDDLEAGAKDRYWDLTEIPAEELSDDQKQFILDRFFDTNQRIIDRFPRYAELLAKRHEGDALNTYTAEDFRDLQVLFNLAWTDPDWLAEEPLASLVAKGSGFDEADKALVLDEHLHLIEQTIPVHKALQDAGRIEVTTTPYAHPILPLLVNTELAREALPDIELPGQEFIYGQDAVAQVEKGVALYEDHFGRPPTGMWPAEGSVAQEIVTMVARNGIEWMASDEGVLAKSLGGDSFTRDSAETVVDADALYRPYRVEGTRGGPVAIIFRDVVISDKVGFTYSGMPGEQAAEDFVTRIHNIRDQLQESGAEGPHLVSVILDGENAWEHYENDGKVFLHTLYQLLSDDPLIETVTPTEFLAFAPEPRPIADLHAGSWINADFATWIGEEEENRGWEYLATTRDFLQSYIAGSRQGSVTEEALNAAMAAMMIAEGSDWFWWYGSDQNSSDDRAFDEQYRNTLKQVYLALGEAPPPFLDVPIIPEQAAAADRSMSGLITPPIDGVIEPEEWDAGGQYLASGGAMAAASPFFNSLTYGFDGQALYIAVDSDAEVWSDAPELIELYLQAPGSEGVSNFSRAGTSLGFPATGMLELLFIGKGLAAATYFTPVEGEWTAVATVETADLPTLVFADQSEGQVAAVSGQIEAALPLSALGDVDEGSNINLRLLHMIPMGGSVAELARLPFSGPAAIVAPDLGTTTLVVDLLDPQNDDHGPGTYTYPQDSIFASGNFDILAFQAGSTEKEIVFKFYLRGPIENVWDSPNGLSLQTLDVYIDTDGNGEGGEAMLPGRNLAFEDGMRWDYAIMAEGWTPGIYIPTAEGPQQIASSEEFKVLVDPALRKVTIRVPKAILGEDPENWRFAAAALSQEGFPSGGVMRVRDVVPEAEQWRIGGASDGTTNHTRVIDLVWPEEGLQERWLSDFEPVGAMQSDLIPSDYARVPMFGRDQ